MRSRGVFTCSTRRASASAKHELSIVASLGFRRFFRCGRRGRRGSRRRGAFRGRLIALLLLLRLLSPATGGALALHELLLRLGELERGALEVLRGAAGGADLLVRRLAVPAGHHGQLLRQLAVDRKSVV